MYVVGKTWDIRRVKYAKPGYDKVSRVTIQSSYRTYTAKKYRSAVAESSPTPQPSSLQSISWYNMGIYSL